MLYGQHWALLHAFAHDQHQAKLCEAAHYRLLKRLQQPTAKSTSHGSRSRRWHQPPPHKGSLATPHLSGGCI